MTVAASRRSEQHRHPYKVTNSTRKYRESMPEYVKISEAVRAGANLINCRPRPSRGSLNGLMSIDNLDTPAASSLACRRLREYIMKMAKPAKR